MDTLICSSSMQICTIIRWCWIILLVPITRRFKFPKIYFTSSSFRYYRGILLFLLLLLEIRYNIYPILANTKTLYHLYII